MQKLIYGSLLAASLAMVGLGVHGLLVTPRPRISLSVAELTVDSAYVRATLDSRDARGNPVRSYDAALTRVAGGDSAVVWQGAIPAGVTGVGTVTIPLLRPQAGDTIRVWLSATAVDSKGSVSGLARSATLTIGTPWSPPTPPTIQIDTLAYEPGHPDGLYLYVAPPTWGGRADVTTMGMSAGPGDTVTVFAFLWREGVMFTPLDSVRWSADSDSVTITPKGWNSALLTLHFQMALNYPSLPEGIPVTMLGRP